jgi:hypothetical protein
VRFQGPEKRPFLKLAFGVDAHPEGACIKGCVLVRPMLADCHVITYTHWG